MLVIDIGNSRIKAAQWQHDAWQNYVAQLYQPSDIQKQLDKLFMNSPVQPVAISCVVDALKAPINEWFVSRWAVTPVFLSSVSHQAGVSNGYAIPESLGVDRWLAMLAAYHKFKSAVCVIDCGTAVTLDVVDSEGQHQGGLIMPGLQLMRASLIMNASDIADLSGEVQELANNTGDAVKSGCLRLLASGLDRLVQEQQHKFKNIKLVMTGGDSELVMRNMQSASVYEETLVLDGVRISVMGS